MPNDAPIGGIDYPETYQAFRDWFIDDAACLEYLEQLRWPDGFVCPVCQMREAWRVAGRRWMCAQCGRKTSVTAGTIFHRSRTPMSTWFAAVWFLTSQKNGISALALQSQLGFGSYETAWTWLHKLRRAMVRPDRGQLSGVVELDETFVGGLAPGKDGAGTDKVPVQIAVERLAPRKLGRVRFAVATCPGSLELVEFACKEIARGATVRTDGARMLRRLVEHGYGHEPVIVYDAEEKDSVLPGVHLVASLLKRWLAGSLQFSVTEKHLAYYLDEYAFRFNRRTSTARGMLFYRLLQQAVTTEPHPLVELVAKS